MNTTTKSIVLGVAIGLLIIGVWKIAVPKRASTNQEITAYAPTPNSASTETKKNESGNVTVSVTPLTLQLGFPPSFDIAFETHSVDLAFDVKQIATLTDETGTLYTPHWDGSPPGGHHRNGTLRFTPDLSAPSTLMLTLKNIAGIPNRVFTWNTQKQ